MSRHSLERYLFDFDKQPALQQALREGAQEAFAGYDLSLEEQRAVREQDAATLYEWGIHPLLIRNFCGTVGVRYVAAYAKRGLQK